MNIKDIEFYQNLPKAELHAHLGGSCRWTTIFEFLRTDSYPGAVTDPATAESTARAIVIPKSADGLPCEKNVIGEYLGFPTISRAHRNDPVRLTRLVHEYLDDCAADGIRLVELRTSGTSRQKIQCILEAIASYDTTKCVCRLILSIDRTDAPNLAHTVVDNAIFFQPNIAAIDFCGVQVVGYPFSTTHAEAIRRATLAGIPFVAHCAEVDGEENIEALLASNPVRLGHCIRMTPHIQTLVEQSNILIEVCLASKHECSPS